MNNKKDYCDTLAMDIKVPTTTAYREFGTQLSLQGGSRLVARPLAIATS